MRDNSRYFHKGEESDFGRLKEIGLGKDIRIAAIMAECEPSNEGPSVETLHEWADEASVLRIALAHAQDDAQAASARAVLDYIPRARVRLERKLS